MKQQTAVEWFFEQMPFEWSSSKAAFEALQQAKEMEKDQIIFAYGNGQQNGRECEQKLSNYEDCNVVTSLQYYNETYKNFKPGTGETEQQ